MFKGSLRWLFMDEQLLNFTWYHGPSTSSYRHSRAPDLLSVWSPPPARPQLLSQRPVRPHSCQKMSSDQATEPQWMGSSHTMSFQALLWLLNSTDLLDKISHRSWWEALSESIAELCCGSRELSRWLKGGILLDIRHCSWPYTRPDCWRWSYSNTDTDRAEPLAEKWIV